ncbi:MULTISPECIES: FliG C-terminal domain-containing protein [unclassified Fusibacter]|uniref:FliG C-terminal domain-containing protein n=1 Tax=unclassified Fusibacter TaxID=2624464 RepID=UPI0010112970|nr:MULTISPECIES: FliG C-terminal domain-containing protein [unclassified Fusibacter]MCK8060625.1 MerR family transcriptional regulator [Fusibacter sp. A2]NPE22921.1 MerR family transcriptional regulator [Fusibacter sp. A1]RXV59988.1 MerR family transcriptional regulator [Fusibacter sp. A1]
MEKLFSIGNLSKRTGVSTRSIRHYESLGLLSCAAVTDSNYRMYSEKEMKRLQQILLLKNLGFSLNEILEVLSVEESVKVAALFEDKLKALDQEAKRITKRKEMLEAVTKIYKNNGYEYISSFHLIKEMVSMNTRFIRIFNRLKVETQIKVLKELYQTGTLLPQTLKEIGEMDGHLFLEELHLILVKSLLNGVDFQTEKNIMETLRESDPEFAKVTMKAMFTFDDFARLPDSVIRTWASKCEDGQLVIALKDSNNYLTNKILMNMHSDRALKLKKELENDELVSLDKSFEAMENLINLLRELEKNGEVVIDRLDY